MSTNELDRLLGSLHAGTLSDAELQRLQQILLENDDALNGYLDSVAVEVLLEELAEAVPVAAPPAVPQNMVQLRHVLMLSFALAAAVLLAVGITVAVMRSPLDGDHLAAQPPAAGPSPLPDPLPLPAPSPLPFAQPTTVAAGQRLAVPMPSGVQAEVLGPAKFLVTGVNTLQLNQGRLSAQVPPDATGFRVRTPNGDVIDHGTVIGVAVDTQGTELHVFEGLAETVLPTDGVSTMVDAGQAVRLNHPDNAGYEPIPLDPAPFDKTPLVQPTRIEFGFDSDSPAWQATQTGSFSDRGDRPESPLTAGEARFTGLLGFVRLPTAPDVVGTFHRQDCFAPHAGDGRVMPLPFHHRDAMESLRLTSPAFHLASGGPIVAYLTGGRGHAQSPPKSVSQLPLRADDRGFLGLALRRVRDGRFVCSVRRKPGNFYEWARVEMSTEQLAEATAGDAAEETYVLDLIDTYQNPHWSWVGLDSVSVPGRLAETSAVPPVPTDTPPQD